MRFQDALDKQGQEIERPPNMPVGTYRWMVSKHPVMDTIADGRFDVVDFQLKCIEPLDDVDADALDNYGTVQGKVMRHRFMFNTDPNEKAGFDRSLYNLKIFLREHLGLGEELDKMSIKEALAESVNREVLASVSWRPDRNDPEIVYDQIDRTAPVE